ncbi:hypothetical protein GUJ93_ZPchr0006g46026 [Zizania palustris]|uniref:Remorin C-terminal domain-containing protein n=1 Tax=Zizania palustris TaxID=103762 RepID=A0A8J5T5D4_ZIZPA|nr:hypothetical protein GUJ93_ZPchr0006g46026 [Zizania palustris]KAG8074003.1 hypothetical protein GUJ93_ZPchr0006g46026 [Zizania palustris]
MSSSEAYDAAFAATIAAAAYAIAAQEEKVAAAEKRSVLVELQSTAPPVQSPVKRGESLKKTTGGIKISRWFSGKQPADEDDDEGPVNVSVRRPLKPAQRKHEDTASDSSLSVKKVSGSSSKSLDKNRSKKLEQEQAIQKAPSSARPATSYHSKRNGDGTVGVAATGSGSTATKADEWEKAKLASIKDEYEKMKETIAEWENEKKGELDRKRAKALEEYNEEVTRISKIAGGARSMAEERRYNDEKKAKEKASRMRSSGKASRRTCACF